MKTYALVTVQFAFLLALVHYEQAMPQPSPPNSTARFKLPPGFVIEVVAAPPLVHHPMMANFDERGRLFLAESSGLNLRAVEFGGDGCGMACS
jgi:hypothetical protein